MPGRHPGAPRYRPLQRKQPVSLHLSHGHVHDIILQQGRFEVLAETAMQALVDGYYREAVTSFAASLERTYQFYIDVVTADAGIDLSLREANWKIVARQSERQLGMFLGLYLMANKVPPPVLASDQLKFRNRVVHQGYLPTEEQAVEFGQAVVNLIQPLLNSMIERYTDVIEAFTIDHMTRAAATPMPPAPGVYSRVFYEFILRFDTEAEDWNPPPANIAEELALRRERAANDPAN